MRAWLGWWRSERDILAPNPSQSRFLGTISEHAMHILKYFKVLYLAPCGDNEASVLVIVSFITISSYSHYHPYSFVSLDPGKFTQRLHLPVTGIETRSTYLPNVEQDSVNVSPQMHTLASFCSQPPLQLAIIQPSFCCCHHHSNKLRGSLGSTDKEMPSTCNYRRGSWSVLALLVTPPRSAKEICDSWVGF
jgi:hypothetical protein